ncbi:hypothetical protein BDV12DRAFT_85744 [Aspergillus spectabilis]
MHPGTHSGEDDPFIQDQRRNELCLLKSPRIVHATEVVPSEYTMDLHQIVHDLSYSHKPLCLAHYDCSLPTDRRLYQTFQQHVLCRIEGSVFSDVESRRIIFRRVRVLKPFVLPFARHTANSSGKLGCSESKGDQGESEGDITVRGSRHSCSDWHLEELG